MIAIQEYQALFAVTAGGEESTVAWQWPLPPETHIPVWQQYEAEALEKGAWQTVWQRLVQLQFPIERGISQSRRYQAATQRGIVMPDLLSVAGLVLQKPEKLSLFIHTSIAGPIPVLKTENHTDFATLVQAILKRNEPVPIPLSTGAYMVAGYNNWDRIHTYQKQWAAENPDNCSETAWQAEFKRLIPQKHLYQDRFIILYDGPYSGVPAREMGLDEAEWRAISLKIRLEHECTHYFTKRVFGMMRRHVFDEMLADYAGIVAALGYYRADWFLRFMGLEANPVYREGGRLQNYLDNVPPQSREFIVTQTQLKAAAENLECFDQQLGEAYRHLAGQALVLLAICRFTLPELAARSASESLIETLHLLEESAAHKIQEGG